MGQEKGQCGYATAWRRYLPLKTSSYNENERNLSKNEFPTFDFYMAALYIFTCFDFKRLSELVNFDTNIPCSVLFYYYFLITVSNN